MQGLKQRRPLPREMQHLRSRCDAECGVRAVMLAYFQCELLV